MRHSGGPKKTARVGFWSQESVTEYKFDLFRPSARLKKSFEEKLLRSFHDFLHSTTSITTTSVNSYMGSIGVWKIALFTNYLADYPIWDTRVSIPHQNEYESLLQTDITVLIRPHFLMLIRILAQNTLGKFLANDFDPTHFSSEFFSVNSIYSSQCSLLHLHLLSDDPLKNSQRMQEQLQNAITLLILATLNRMGSIMEWENILLTPSVFQEKLQTDHFHLKKLLACDALVKSPFFYSPQFIDNLARDKILQRLNLIATKRFGDFLSRFGFTATLESNNIQSDEWIAFSNAYDEVMSEMNAYLYEAERGGAPFTLEMISESMVFFDLENTAHQLILSNERYLIEFVGGLFPNNTDGIIPLQTPQETLNKHIQTIACKTITAFCRNAFTLFLENNEFDCDAVGEEGRLRGRLSSLLISMLDHFPLIRDKQTFLTDFMMDNTEIETHIDRAQQAKMAASSLSKL